MLGTTLGPLDEFTPVTYDRIELGTSERSTEVTTNGDIDSLMLDDLLQSMDGLGLGPWLVKMEERLFGFVLTDILGNLESSVSLGAPDTDGDSLGISFPSLTGTSLAIVDGPLLCIELGAVLDNIASEGVFEGISEGDTEPLTPN